MPLQIVRNDITKMTVDAIVLPANPKLAEGPGLLQAVIEASKKQDGHKDHERNHKRGTKRKSSS